MKKILIVDDEVIIRKTISALLKAHNKNYDIYIAENGLAGLKTAQKINPDIILLDVMMPEMDGLEVCRVLKSKEKCKSIPILMITALNDRKDILKGLSAGADDYIAKPFNPAELTARVTSHLKMKEMHDSLVLKLELQDNFLMMLVHDFKTPLLSMMENLKSGHKEITNLLNKLADENKKSDVSGLRKEVDSLKNELKFISGAEESGQILWRRINNLLDSEKIKEEQFNLELSDFDVVSLVEDAASEMSIAATSNGVNLNVNNLDAETIVYTDYDLILRVLTNLISNAIKHSGKDMEGKEEVNLSVKDEGENITFEVLDTGPGIPEDFQNSLFDKFSQMKRVKGSTGLGLTFSKLAVESLRGEINAKNTENSGALFCFSIPRRHKEKSKEVSLDQWKFE